MMITSSIRYPILQELHATKSFSISTRSVAGLRFRREREEELRFLSKKAN